MRKTCWRKICIVNAEHFHPPGNEEQPWRKGAEARQNWKREGGEKLRGEGGEARQKGKKGGEKLRGEGREARQEEKKRKRETKGGRMSGTT